MVFQALEPNHKRLFAIPAVLAVFVAAVFAPVEVPYAIGSMVKIQPAQSWVLTQMPDGFLSYSLYDHLSGKVKIAEAFQSEWGDLVRVLFEDSSEYVRAGVPMAVIVSSKLEEDLSSLKNQLAVEFSNKEVISTGEKEQVLGKLKEEMNLAEEGRWLQKKNVERARILFADGVIAQTEMEQAENGFREAEAKVAVAEKALAAASTGEKKETLALASTRISALQKQIQFLEGKKLHFAFRAPFDGSVRMELSTEGDRLIVEDTSISVLTIPVRLSDSRFLQPGQGVRFRFPDMGTELPGKILEVGPQVEFVNGEQALMVRAKAKTGALPSGMPLRCEMGLEPVRVSEYLRRSIQWR